MRATDATLLVAESKADTSTLAHLLTDNVRLQKGQGKINCVGAHDYLTTEERKRAVFLVDCDGEDNDKILGGESLVITENRDLEADLFFRLTSFENIIVSRLASADGDVKDFRDEARKCLLFAQELATNVGIILDTAVQRGYQVKLWDNIEGKKRRIGIRDIARIDNYCSELATLTVAQILDEFATLLGWPEEAKHNILRDSAVNALRLCRYHATADCSPCKARRFANGHELVDIGARLVALRIVGEHEKADFKAFERLLRSSYTPSHLNQWGIVHRVRKFEEWSGKSVLRA